MHADSWIGSDVSIPVTVRITEMSKADKEGRTYRGKALPLDDDTANSAGCYPLLHACQCCRESLQVCVHFSSPEDHQRPMGF